MLGISKSRSKIFLYTSPDCWLNMMPCLIGIWTVLYNYQNSVSILGIYRTPLIKLQALIILKVYSFYSETCTAWFRHLAFADGWIDVHATSSWLPGFQVCTLVRE